MKKEIINVESNKKNNNKKTSFSRSLSYSKPTIKFSFELGEELLIDKNIFLTINPKLTNNKNFKIKFFNNNSIQINIPKNISKEDISLFCDLIKYFKNNNNTNEIKEEEIIDKNKIMNIFNISDLFMSEDFNMKFIKNILLKINYLDKVLDIVYYSYKKLCIYKEKNEEINNIYFDLFYQSLEMISKNEQIVFNNLDKIKNLDKKIIDEIIEKTFKNLIYGNTILLEESDELDAIKEEYENIENNLHIIKIEQLNKLIEFLMEINKSKNNFFDLITSEYAFLLSKNSILELKTLPHPSLQVDIHFSDYSFYCQEFPLDIILNHKKIILIVSYKTEDQSFNINIKLLNNRMATQKNINSILEIDRISEEKYIEDNSCFKIFTFLTHVQITKGPEKITIATQNNLLSLSDSKTVYNILKISNFDNELRNFLIREPEKEYFSVIVQIKLCYKYSTLASYLLRQFNLYYNDKNISKISKQLLMLILENKFLKINKNNEMVTSILLWLEDEINIKEDISSIFDIIQWENVDESLIFELIIKYAHIIVNNKKLEKIFINIFEKKYNNSSAVTNILKSLFNAGVKIEYNKLFIQMKKSQKNNKIYKYFNSENNFKQNHFFEYDNENNESSNSKDSFPINDVKHFLEESNKKENKKIKNYTFNNSINDINEENLNKNNDIKKSKNKSNEKLIKIKQENCENKIKNNSNNIINKINKESQSILQKFNKINNENKNFFIKKINPKLLSKNMSLINIKQEKNIKTINNKKIEKKESNSKVGHSYIKSMKKVLKDNKNFNKVSININNINNINISNSNFQSFNKNNNLGENKYNNNINTNSFSLTFCSNKNNKKINERANNIKNSSFKLFATSNNDKSNLFNMINKTNNNESTLDNLLSCILKNDKNFNKSKHKFDKQVKIKKISTKKLRIKTPNK